MNMGRAGRKVALGISLLAAVGATGCAGTMQKLDAGQELMKGQHHVTDCFDAKWTQPKLTDDGQYMKKTLESVGEQSFGRMTVGQCILQGGVPQSR